MLSKLINNTIITLTANYGTKAIIHFVNKYGIQGLLHSKIKANPSSDTALTLHDLAFDRVRTSKYIYPFSIASSLYLSHQHMQNIRRTEIPKILRQLLYIRKLSRVKSQSLSVRLYTVLYCLKDSRLSTQWQDKSNGKYSYTMLHTLYSKLSHQISSNKTLSNVHLLCESNELPYHLNTNNYHTAGISDVYGHPHSHFILAVTDVNQLQQLRSNITTNFSKVCGYNPIHLNIQPLYINGIKPAIINGRDDTASITALIKTVKYLLTDYHLQTKDCNLSILKALPPYLAHKIVSCQLNSTKHQQCQHCITDHAVNKTIKQIDEVRVLKRYKSVSVGHSVPLFSSKIVPEAKSTNGRTFTRHHTSENEALNRIYGHGYYFTEDEHSVRQQVTISLFKGVRTPYDYDVKGTTAPTSKLPTDDFKQYLKIIEKKKYLNHYLDTS